MLKFGLIANTGKDAFWKKLPDLLQWFEHHQFPLILSQEIALHPNFPGSPPSGVEEAALPSQCDMILAIGGDGTMLHTVQLVGAHQTPILGINVGGLGFLTDVSLEHFAGGLERIARGEYRIEDRLMIRGDIEGDPDPLYALNEIVIDKSRSVRVIQVETLVDGELLNHYIADGLIVSTSTGSTGYSLSSGGPVIAPTSPVVIINPICPHSLTNRPVVIPDSSVITATTYTEHTEFLIAADGRDMRYCRSRTRITIRKAPFCARLVKVSDSSFFKILQTKLNWGEDFRNKKRWSYNS
ncbi:MAG: ATP-NAD kinase [Calditrichaeota bacterium]|nr:MAG: ATP-NAD kinase [Calditrichota bacterium]